MVTKKTVVQEVQSEMESVSHAATPSNPWDASRPASEMADLNKMKTLLFGPNGTGKSTMGARIGRVLIGVTELQAIPAIRRTNPSALVVTIETAQDLFNFRKMIRSPELAQRVDAVAVDSFTDLQRIIVEYYTKHQASGRQITDKDTWNVIAAATLRIAKELRDLPVHTLVMCLAEEEQIEGEGMVHRASVQGKVKHTFGQFFNLVGYAHRKESAAGLRYEVLFQGPSRYQCKPFFGIDSTEPPEPELWIKKCFDPEKKLSVETEKRIADWHVLGGNGGKTDAPAAPAGATKDGTTADPFAI